MVSELTELEASKLQKEGQDLYRQKKYQAALQRFNAVDHPPCISNHLLTSTRYFDKTGDHYSPPLTAERQLMPNSVTFKLRCEMDGG